MGAVSGIVVVVLLLVVCCPRAVFSGRGKLEPNRVLVGAAAGAAAAGAVVVSNDAIMLRRPNI